MLREKYTRNTIQKYEKNIKHIKKSDVKYLLETATGEIGMYFGQIIY